MKDLLNLLDFDFHFPITDPTWIFFLVLVIILLAPIILVDQLVSGFERFIKGYAHVMLLLIFLFQFQRILIQNYH